MKFQLTENGVWYHGSPERFTLLRAGSTITQWRALAEAFSHKPQALSYEDDGSIWQNGTLPGYLYVIDEPILPGRDVEPHPRSTMDANVEFLTKRPLRVRCIAEVPL